MVPSLKNSAAHGLDVPLWCVDGDLADTDLVPDECRLTDAFDGANAREGSFDGEVGAPLDGLLPA